MPFSAKCGSIVWRFRYFVVILHSVIKYQGIPIGGYNKLINGLLEGIKCMTDVDFFKDRSYWVSQASKIVYSGKIDEYFNYQLGRLNWRSLAFRTRTENIPNYQGNAVINYTSHDQPYTRIIEHKHFEMFGQEVYNCPNTVITEEYSGEFETGMEPYYPINDDYNNRLAKMYHELASSEPNVIFGGRLAEYKYYDMAPIVEKVIKMNLQSLDNV